MGIRDKRADKHFEVDENIRGFAVCMQEITGIKTFSYFLMFQIPTRIPKSM